VPSLRRPSAPVLAMPDWIIDGHAVSISVRPKSASDPTLYYDYYRPDGLRRRKSLQTTDPVRALLGLEAVRRLIEQDIRDGCNGATSGPSLNPRIADLCAYYTDVYLPNRNAKPKSIAKARQELTEFQLYCADRRVGRAQQVSRAILDGWVSSLRERSRHAKTIKNRLGTVRAMLNAAIEAGRIEASPITRWPLPAVPEPEIQPLTLAQVKLVVSLIKDRRPDLNNAVRWIAYTGARPEDCCQLRWHQVDLDTASVARVQAKSPRLKKYPISASAVAVLREEAARKVQSPYVFTDELGGPFTPHVLYRRFTRAVKDSDLGRHVCLKDLRHSFGYNMANIVGMPIPVLQVCMGHADIKTTMRYVQASEGRSHLDAWDKLLKT
jgi:integrase